ncbi:MAG: hypothetical protein ACREQN_17560 [Candidatus Binataceae bacterium]
MTSIALCLAAFILCYVQGRKALWRGVAAVIVVGCFYGILRANVLQAASHFIFDAGAAGLYLAIVARPLTRIARIRIRPLMPWIVCLVAWPLLLFLVPIQNPLVQLVGLRGAIFFLPFLLIGAMLENQDWYNLAWTLAWLNLVALGFALAEVHFGLTRFYPFSAVTRIIYMSEDVRAGQTFVFRIPAIFTSSAAYAGMMTASVPLLAGALSLKLRQRSQRYLFLAALAAAALGVFLAASRTQAVILIMLIVGVCFSGRMRALPVAGWIAIIGGVALVVSMVPRLQRFTTLNNTGYVENRIEGSVNDDFLDLMVEYPMGNGLGGGGTSMPYFLQGLIKNPIGIENDYARIMLEEGIPGLLLWVAFIVWIFTRPSPRESERWYLARWLARFVCMLAFAEGMIGTGMLTAIPGTAVMLMFVGWLAAPAMVPVTQAVTRYRASERRRAGAMFYHA